MLDGEKIDEYIKQIDAEKDEEADKKKTKKWEAGPRPVILFCLSTYLIELNTTTSFL